MALSEHSPLKTLRAFFVQMVILIYEYGNAESSSKPFAVKSEFEIRHAPRGIAVSKDDLVDAHRDNGKGPELSRNSRKTGSFAMRREYWTRRDICEGVLGGRHS